MIVDWNWFFAAFAQSAAALIAIIGAFIISKLLGENEKEEMQSNKIDELIIYYNDLINRISIRYFNWYDKQNIAYSSDLEDSIKRGDFRGLQDEEMLQRLFEIESGLFKTEGCLEKLKERITKVKSTTIRVGDGLSILPPITGSNFPPKGLWDELYMEKETINLLEIESKTLINKFNRIRGNITITKKNLIPIKNAIYILGIGLILTVIYPLHFMPIEINQNPSIVFSFEILISNIFSIKGLLLILLSIVIEGLFGYFLLLVKRTEKKYDKQLAQKLEDKYFDISTYSNYFESH